jgi:hypothetical protein
MPLFTLQLVSLNDEATAKIPPYQHNCYPRKYSTSNNKRRQIFRQHGYQSPAPSNLAPLPCLHHRHHRATTIINAIYNGTTHVNKRQITLGGSPPAPYTANCASIAACTWLHLDFPPNYVLWDIKVGIPFGTEQDCTNIWNAIGNAIGGNENIYPPPSGLLGSSWCYGETYGSV